MDYVKLWIISLKKLSAQVHVTESNLWINMEVVEHSGQQEKTLFLTKVNTIYKQEFHSSCI